MNRKIEDRQCTYVEGGVRCERPLCAKGLCSKHWQRLYSNKGLKRSAKQKMVERDTARCLAGQHITITRQDPPANDYGLAPRFTMSNLSRHQLKIIVVALTRYTATCQSGSIAHQLLADIPTDVLVSCIQASV